MRALVVEDDTMLAKIFGMVIASFFSNVVYAINGEEGFREYCEAIEKDQPFDVIFLDIMMPKVTGLQMLELVRNRERDFASGPVKIIMLTALDDQHTKDTAFKLGCDYYLKKPVDKAGVKSCLAEIKLI